MWRRPLCVGNKRTWTISVWIKRNKINTPTGSIQGILGDHTGNTFLRFNDDGNGDEFRFYKPDNSIYVSPALRDPNSWYHLVLAVDSTANYENERFKFYKNGIYIDHVRAGNVASNYEALRFMHDQYTMSINSTNLSGQLGTHQMCDMYMVDGRQLGPEDFGYFKRGVGYESVGTSLNHLHTDGIWMPKAPRIVVRTINGKGGFGPNGCYLPMNSGANVGADFRISEPDTILKLKTNLSQPKATVDGDSKDSLRQDPLAKYLILACPFDVNGLENGRGDYGGLIRGDGINKSIGPGGVVQVVGEAPYGSMVDGREQPSAMTFNGSQRCDLGDDGQFEFGKDEFTIECWVKQTAHQSQTWFSKYDVAGGSAERTFWFGCDSSGYHQFYYYSGGNTYYVGGNLLWSPIVNQWYHICAERSITASDEDRITLYINGHAVAWKDSDGHSLNSTDAKVMLGGNDRSSGSGNLYHFAGQLKDLRVYRGIAKYRGGFDVPNHWATNDLPGWRVRSDAPRNNFLHYNYLDHYPGSGEPSNGALTHSTAGITQGSCGTTMMVSSGKWYVELRADNAPAVNSYFGIDTCSASGRNFSHNESVYALYRYNDGNAHYSTTKGGGATSASYTSAASSGDIIGMAFDVDAKKLEFYVNGIKKPIFPIPIPEVAGSTHYHVWINTNAAHIKTLNAGQNPSFNGNVSAGTYKDASGLGTFKYPVPNGYNALCTRNLPEPIKDSGKYFRIIRYLGEEGGSTGTSRKITGLGFKPDLVWLKPYDLADNWVVTSSSGKQGNFLYLNGTAARAHDDLSGYGKIISLNDDGVSIGPWNNLNNTGDHYHLFGWKAGGMPTDKFPYMRDDIGYGSFQSLSDSYENGISTSTENGMITPTKMSVGTKQGFSIVNYDGAGATREIPHGLNKKPCFIVTKILNDTGNFGTYHHATGDTHALRLSDTDGKEDLNTAWGDTSPTDTHFTVGSWAGSGQSSKTYEAWCWAETEGFSKFGTYAGNGNANGTFVYCGFRPAFVMCKRHDGSESWFVHTSTEDSLNPCVGGIRPNDSGVETSTKKMDLVSNGFKAREITGYFNDSGAEYVYAAFAECPFKYANAR